MIDGVDGGGGIFCANCSVGDDNKLAGMFNAAKLCLREPCRGL